MGSRGPGWDFHPQVATEGRVGWAFSGQQGRAESKD